VIRLVSRFLALLTATSLLLAGCEARSLPPGGEGAAPTLAEVPESLRVQLQEAEGRGELVEVELISPDARSLQQVSKAVAELGGTVQEIRTGERQVKALLPPGAVEELVSRAPVTAVGTNRTLYVEPGALAEVAAPADNVVRAAALESIHLNFQAMKLQEFRRLTGATGEGVRIAIVDTGVDPIHSDLQRTAGGARKLIDWKDFTTEGTVQTETVGRAPSFTAVETEWQTGAIQSASGRLMFGVWEEVGVHGRIGRDLDRNGSVIDWYGVLVVDSVTPGVYDRVYVDLNRNRSFADETPLRIFRETGETFRLGTPRGGRDERVGFVVADIGRDGRSVSFGFDGHGHGTQVAGTAASASTGIAPGAQIMALKALRSDGSGEWFHIQNAIRYAVENGAQIVNISVQDLVTAARFDATASEWLNEIARRHGVLIVAAAGNSGPGLSSGATLGDASEIVTAGGYFSPEIWERDWGYRLPSEGVWTRTGMGPRSDGTVVPSLIAPASVPAPTPQWLSPTGYRTEEGTSIATPHVTGVAALLMDAAGRQGISSDYKSVKRALEMGARPLAGYQIIEQGHGLVQADAAWEHLTRIDSIAHFRAVAERGGSGLFARSFTPGSAEFAIQNLGGADLRVGLVSLADWVQVGRQSLLVPAGRSRVLPVSYRAPATPGLHSAFIVLREFGNYGPTIWVPTTFVAPHPLVAANGFLHQVEGTIPAARYQRQFYQVPAGTSLLTVHAQVAAAPEPAGRIQFFVFRPDGQEVYRSPVLGAGGTGLATTTEIPNPIPGTWEVVVSSLPDVIRHRPANPTSEFSLSVSASPVLMDPWPLRAVLEPGTTGSIPVRFTNHASPFFGQVTAAGLLRPDRDLSRDWEVRRRLGLIDTLEIRLFTSLLKVEVAGADLTVELWRGDQAIASGRNGFEVQNLPAGRYQVIAQAVGSQTEVRYQYRRLVLVDDVMLLADDRPRQRARGESWTVPLAVRAPSEPGRYVGYLLLRDAQSGRILNWHMLEVQVGLPALRVSSMTSSLVQNGSGYVTLEVREQGNGRPVDVVMTVAGRRYQVRNGRVTIPIADARETLALPVSIEDPRYQYLSQSVRVHLPPRWAGLPIGSESQEISSGQRKLIDGIEALRPDGSTRE
jgi:subtilisin family serine protease